MSKNWREIKEGKTILKFIADKEHETLVVKFLSEGRVVNFKTPIYNEHHVITGYKEAESVEFDVEFKGSETIFTTGSSRLITALQNVADDLKGKRVKMVKDGIGMDTMYSASLMK